MEQLRGPEHLCLELESDGMPMQVSLLTIYDRASAPGGRVEFRDIQRHFAERAHRSPVFRRRLAVPPLGLARPYWVDDPGFDIEFHLRHIALPKPGDWRQLCTQVARLHARPLDRARPLWECYVIDELDRIDGVPRGSFALATKIHYAALAGGLGGALFSALHELSPQSRASPPKRAPYFDRPPTAVDLVLRSALDTLRAPSRIVRVLGSQAAPLAAVAAKETADVLRYVVTRRREAGLSAAPRTRFNARVSPHRVTEGVGCDLAAVDKVRAAVPGAGTDDVALAVIGGALARYLEARLETAAASLVADAPAANRAGRHAEPGRAFADSTLRSLHSDVEDPRARLVLVAADAARGSASGGAHRARRLALGATELVPAAVVAAVCDVLRRVRPGSRFAPLVNTTITSLRGPDVPLYLAGARLVGCYGQAAVHDLAGLAHVVASCGGEMTITATACRAMLPDPERYADCLRASWRELCDAFGVDPPRIDAMRSERGRPTRRATRRNASARTHGAGAALQPENLS